MLHRIVVVGASLAGLRAAETLRDRGFDGELTLIGEEPHRPYDRPPLSKQCSRARGSRSRPFSAGKTGTTQSSAERVLAKDRSAPAGSFAWMPDEGAILLRSHRERRQALRSAIPDRVLAARHAWPQLVPKGISA